eukprot:gene891-642_t
MIAIIFEVIPAEGQKQTYLDIAAAMRPELDKIDGFISIERFESLSMPAQCSGRHGVFADYRLRVAHVIRDYGMNEREEAPADSKQIHG